MDGGTHDQVSGWVLVLLFLRLPCMPTLANYQAYRIPGARTSRGIPTSYRRTCCPFSLMPTFRDLRNWDIKWVLPRSSDAKSCLCIIAPGGQLLLR